VIHNGLVLKEPPVWEGPSIREEFGIPHDAPIVGAICRLTRVKGIEYLVEAAGIVHARHPNAYFVVLGDGERKTALIVRAKELGVMSRVIFTGFRTDTHRFLREFTISVLPSLTEGLSNTVMESMAAGVPVVATNVGGTPEIVSDGVTGLLVEPRSPQLLANALSTLLGNLEFAKRIGAAGKRHIVQEFSMEQAVRRTEALYAELLGTRNRRQVA
jgi:glycosyltransferase involved in cell wall biosynthesis